MEYLIVPNNTRHPNSLQQDFDHTYASTFCVQDVFPVIPGDTDYRIFSQDYGDIPGLDIIFLIGGYYYHTSHDTVDRLLYELHLLFWYKFTCVEL